MYTNTMITYNNVLIQYRYRCISITYMIKNFRTSKRTVWRIEFRVVQNFDVVSNKALISDETDSTIHIYPPPISILFLLPSYRFETRMFETNWNDSSLLRHLRPIWNKRIRKRQWSKKYPNIWKISRLDTI